VTQLEQEIAHARKQVVSDGYDMSVTTTSLTASFLKLRRLRLMIS
jgi:hypothetical protein